MISVHRDYVLSENPGLHAHVEVNPTGKLELEIIETREHHVTEFDKLRFETLNGRTKLAGMEERDPWQFELSERDGKELSELIMEANEEYEILMRDLL